MRFYFSQLFESGASIINESSLLIVDAILFDLDGVLVDSNHLADRHWEMWAAKHGLPFGPIAAAHHGRPTLQTMREFAPHLDIEKEAAEKENREADDTDGLSAFTGALRLLSSIPEDRWAIGTSGRRRTATTRLSFTNLPIPRILITADDVKVGKPDPEPYLLGAAGLGFRPEKCLVFEDAPSGIAAGKAAGATVVAIATTNPPENLRHADAIISQLDDIDVAYENGSLKVTLRQTISVR
ncbi:HAD-IA family hydrolase [Planctomicrobium sp. SH668]|uniref:HAD-IA family hydrolase n=1 Tax=Planctomicrobium sp. SH668 TaxID=3448126 RepID=UPI003F5C33CF